MKREFRDRKGPSQSSSGPFFKPSVQAKLSVGKPGDAFEREADTVADKVVSKTGAGDVQKAEMPAEEDKMQKKPVAESISSVQKKDLQGEEQLQKAEAPAAEDDQKLQKAEAPAAEEDQKLQKVEDPEKDDKSVQKAEMPADEKKDDGVQKAEMPGDEKKEGAVQKAEAALEEKQDEAAAPVQQKSNGTSGRTAEAKLSSAKGKGSPLSGRLKQQMESGFGADLSNVRIHTDTEAEQMSAEMGAQAFTHGKDVYFNKGKFDPNSKEGQHLIAHELTHTIQQDGGGMSVQKKGEEETEAKPQTQGGGQASAAGPEMDAEEKPAGQRSRGRNNRRPPVCHTPGTPLGAGDFTNQLPPVDFMVSNGRPGHRHPTTIVITSRDNRNSIPGGCNGFNVFIDGLLVRSVDPNFHLQTCTETRIDIRHLDPGLHTIRLEASPVCTVDCHVNIMAQG